MIVNECSEHEDIGEGQIRATFTAAPRFFHDGEAWTPITNLLDTTSNPNFTHGISEHLTVRFRKKLNGNNTIVIRRNSTWLALTALNTNQVTGEVSGNKSIYAGAWDNADLEFEIIGHVVRKNIYLRAGHPQSFSFRLESKTPDFDLSTLTGDGLAIIRPYLAKEGEENVLLDWDISAGAKPVLTVTLPAGDWSGWTLDPTFTDQSAADNFIIDIDPNTNNSTANFLAVENYDDGVSTDVAKSLLKFNFSSIPSGSTVTGASLQVTQYNSTFGTDTHTIAVYRVRRAWTAAQATWNIAATGTNWGTAGCSNTSTDYDSTALGSLSLASNGTGNKTFTLTNSKIQEMLSGGTFTDNGFLLDDISAASIYSFQCRSNEYTTAAQRPLLTITYTAGGTTNFITKVFDHVGQGIRAL